MRALKRQLIDGRGPSHAGIMSGICKGNLWVNDKTDPTLAVTYSYCVGGCGITGIVKEGKEKEARAFFEHVFLDLRKQGVNEFEFSIEEEALCKKVLELFQDKAIESEGEYSYRKSDFPEPVKEISSQYKLRQVDASFLNDLYDGKWENSEMLLERLENSWYSETDFLENSCAYVAMENQCIIGIIFGSARYEEYIVVDIEVVRSYQNQGIASKLSEIFIRNCVQKGITVQWDHTESNKRSQALAKKLGFTLFKNRPFYWFEI